MANWTTIRDVINGNLDNSNISATAAIAASKTEIGSFTEWTSYSCSWTSTGTAPAIGNGSITARYRKIGKSIRVQIRAIFGSTTTFGTGNYRFSLPTTSANNVTQALGIAHAAASPDSYNFAIIDSNTAIVIPLNASGINFSATSPTTFANGDNIIIDIEYESAT